MARFTFIGQLEANTDESSKGYYLREGKTKGGDKYCSINLQVVQEKNNRGFVELFGVGGKPVMTMDKDNKKISVDWSDRFDEDAIKEVADFKKYSVGIGDEKKKFIASYDAVKYIAEHIDELKGKTVVVTGQRKKNVYEGKISDRFEFSSLRTTDNEDSKNRLTVNMDLVFNKDSIDTADWKDEHKLLINGYALEYMSDVKENRYVPQQIVFDCSKVDFENEKHVKMVKFRLKMLGCDLDENNKVVVKLKAKKLYQMGIITSFINGQEEVPFDESCLTEQQKEALELGLKTLDDFKPAGAVYGQRVVIYKLKDFDMRAEGKYTEGYIEVELTDDEFEEKLYKIEEPASVNDLVDDNDELPFEDTKKEEDDDDLFG